MSDRYPTLRMNRPHPTLRAGEPEIEVIDIEMTSPVDLLEREPDHEVQSAVDRSRRNGDDPATYADVVKLAVALTRERTDNRQRELASQEVLRAPRDAARSSRRHLIAAVIAAGASIAGAIERCSDHSSTASGEAVRVQQQDRGFVDRATIRKADARTAPTIEAARSSLARPRLPRHSPRCGRDLRRLWNRQGGHRRLRRGLPLSTWLLTLGLREANEDTK